MNPIKVHYGYGMYFFEFGGLQVWCMNLEEIQNLSNEFNLTFICNQ